MTRLGEAMRAANQRHTTTDANRARNKLAAKLRAERVAGSEYTPAELEQLHRQLKADYLAREAQRRAAA